MLQVISGLGIFVLMLLAWAMSSHRNRVDWKLVFGGLLLQFGLAALILWTPPGIWVFQAIGDFFNQVLGFVDVGAGFVFGVNARASDPELPPNYLLLRTFAFGVMPTVIFFSSFMSVLYYLGLMQWIVYFLGKLMQKTLGTSGAESLAAAANVFVGHTEAPLVVRPYVERMTISELHALMVGGFATISGGLMAAYAGMGIDPGHLLTASVISAPAALLISKLMLPETEIPETSGTVKLADDRTAVNVIDAAAQGATDGLKLALNIGAILIAFLAMIAMADALLAWMGTLWGYQGESAWSLAMFMGYLFSPIAWLMGIEQADCRAAGELLGLKMVANEFLAYEKLGSWLMEDSPVQISRRTEIILTYALCGFSNFGAIGIQIGGIGGLAPSRRGDLARYGLRAMIGGAIACCMTACIAGILIAG